MTIIGLRNAFLHPKKVGHKASSLSILFNRGFPILDGYVLCEPLIDSELKYLWELMKDKTPLVVRSSMSEEDGKEKSYAGKYETKLGISKWKEFKIAIYEVLNSNLEQTPSKQNAVLIQPMFQSFVSGVTFSSCEQQEMMLIETIYGFGELLVSGQITPDTIMVNKESKEKTIIMSKQKYYGLFPSMHHDELLSGDVLKFKKGKIRVLTSFQNRVLGSIPYKLRKVPTLEKKQIDLLVNECQKIEDYFHYPQDIEWAFDSEGKFAIMQARPITKFISVNCYQNQDNELVGIPVSKGLAKGEVVMFPSKTHQLNEESILVTYEMQPYMIYQLNKVKAILTETGGRLCHAAIVARELNIPCIVGIQNLTDVLKDGDEIKVDANRGVITIC